MFTVGDITGTLERQKDSTHVVSINYCPQGYDRYNQMRLPVFFPGEQAAREFADKWKNMPEMASVLTLDHHDILISA